MLDVMVPAENPVPRVDRLQEYGDVEECRIEFHGICKKCKKNKRQA